MVSLRYGATGERVGDIRKYIFICRGVSLCSQMCMTREPQYQFCPWKGLEQPEPSITAVPPFS